MRNRRGGHAHQPGFDVEDVLSLDSPPEMYEVGDGTYRHPSPYDESLEDVLAQRFDRSTPLDKIIR